MGCWELTINPHNWMSGVLGGSLLLATWETPLNLGENLSCAAQGEKGTSLEAVPQ